MKILCPGNLDYYELLKKLPDRLPNGRKLVAEHVFFLIDKIATRIIQDRDDLVDSDGYVQLYSWELNDQIPSYKEVIRCLIKEGIIESNDSYVASNIASSSNFVRCIGYRLSETYNTEFKEIELNDLRLKRLKRSAAQFSYRQRYEYKHLLQWFDERLILDKEAALDYNQRQYDEIKNDKTKWKSKIIHHPFYGKVPSGEPKDPYRGYKARINKIKYFRNPDLFTRAASRRLYTSLTSLNKDLRRFLTYDGQPLVSLDVSSCQPYLVLPLLDPAFWTDDHLHFSIGDINQYHIARKYRSIIKSFYLDDNKYIYMLDKIQDSQGFQRYRDDVTSGHFYQRFYDKHKNSLGKDCLWDDPHLITLDDLKWRMLMYLNADYRWNSPVKQGFKIDYPEVHELLMFLKSLDDSNEISTILMSMEATLMLFRIAKTLSSDYPMIPIFSIHDSLVTTLGYEEFVEMEMIEEFEKCIGIAPKIKTEHWK